MCMRSILWNDTSAADWWEESCQEKDIYSRELCRKRVWIVWEVCWGVTLCDKMHLEEQNWKCWILILFRKRQVKYETATEEELINMKTCHQWKSKQTFPWDAAESYHHHESETREQQPGSTRNCYWLNSVQLSGLWSSRHVCMDPEPKLYHQLHSGPDAEQSAPEAHRVWNVQMKKERKMKNNQKYLRVAPHL